MQIPPQAAVSLSVRPKHAAHRPWEIEQPFLAWQVSLGRHQQSELTPRLIGCVAGHLRLDILSSPEGLNVTRAGAV